MSKGKLTGAISISAVGMRLGLLWGAQEAWAKSNPAVPPKEVPKPNFVFFLTDDQRWDAMSCAGNAILKTPNMDRIASNGIRFTNAFVVSSLCAPSRATFLTGKYPHTHGIRTNRAKQVFSPEISTFPQILKNNGYEIAFIGKWHIPPGHGRRRGFDYYFGFRGQGRYFDPFIAENDGPFIKREGHVTDILTDKAVEFLNKPRDKPFCLLFWFKAPHRSWKAAERFQKLYEDITISEPDTFDETFDDKPQAVKYARIKIGDFRDVRDLDTFVKRYYQTLVGVDENIGRVLDTLDELGLTKNTVVIHAGDNGFFLGEHHFFDKRLMYEESIRIPCLIHYPKMVKAGSLSEEMVLNVDFAPTILALAGVSIPKDMQGRSFKSILKGKKVKWRDAWLYEYYEWPGTHAVRKNRGIRTRKWKYIHFFEEPQEYELYNIQNDSHEFYNLIEDPQYEKIIARIRKRMVGLRRKLKDPDLLEE